MSLKPIRRRLVTTLSLIGFVVSAPNALAADLSTDSAKYSYTLGHQVAMQLKAKGLDVNGDAFAAAIGDVLSGREPQMQRAEMQKSVEVQQAAEDAKLRELGDANLQAGKDFLADNATQEGVVVLDSGLQYRVETEGSGATPGADDRVEVHYRGTLMDGTEFDSSYKRGKPAEFNVGQVIPGFSAALQLMKVGSKWTVFIPSDMGYGETGIPGGPIGPNETLTFELELLDIKS